MQCTQPLAADGSEHVVQIGRLVFCYEVQDRLCTAQGERTQILRDVAEEKAKAEATAKERTDIEAGSKLTYEKALDYIIPPQGAIYAGKSFRCLLKEKGKMAVISFASYFMKKTSESDPMYKVYQMLATH